MNTYFLGRKTNLKILNSLSLLVLLCAISRELMGLVFPYPQPGNDVIGQMTHTTVQYGETFIQVAQRFNMGYHELAEANPTVDPWTPPVGAKLVVPQRFILPPGPRKGIVINLAELRLYYFDQARRQVVTFPIGIGRYNWKTPLGKTSIIQKKKNPDWHVPESIRKDFASRGQKLPRVVPAGPDNPLGQYALRLGITGYLIHGTNRSGAVGLRVSSGCIRMRPDDIEKLFALVHVGTPVRIIHQHYNAGWSHGKLLFEAHKPLSDYGITPDPSSRELLRVLKKQEAQHGPIPIDWHQLRRIITQAYGYPVVIGRERKPTMVSLPAPVS